MPTQRQIEAAQDIIARQYEMLLQRRQDNARRNAAYIKKFGPLPTCDDISYTPAVAARKEGSLATPGASGTG